MLDEYLTPAEVNALTGLPESTRRWRQLRGLFPAPLPLGPRGGLYERRAVEAWMNANGGRYVGKGISEPTTFCSVANYRRADQARAAVARIHPLGSQVVELDGGLFAVEITTRRRDAVALYLAHQMPGFAWHVEPRSSGRGNESKAVAS